MEGMPEKFKAALDVFRTMLEKAGLREGVKVADDLLKELEEHHIAPPTTEQTELWKEAFSVANISNLHNAEIAELNRKYSITRKQEVPEAVEFTEWANERYTWVEKDKWDGDNDETFRTAELYKEFQLFKNRS